MDKSTLFMKDHLVRHIENQLGWGTGATWGNKDFQELGERIFKKTNKRLSVTTLKRIWGRTEWVADPSMATLDILSEFLDYESWRDFVQKNNKKPTEKSISNNQKQMKIGGIVLTIAIIGALFFYFKRASLKKADLPKTYNSEDFTFRSRPVSDEIPNSVVFEYDASKVHDSSIVEIQQSWDDNKRILVDKNDSIATCIYYRPGFFKAKLVVDNKIVEQHDVFITTKDWMGVIERKTLPIYLKKEDIFKESQMEISTKTVTSHGLDPKTSKVIVSFYQVKNFGELYTDDFEMTASLKNSFSEGISACQETRTFILYDGGAIGIPLAKIGCSSNLSLMAFDKSVDGKKNDLSNFGVDFNDHIQLKCISKNKKLTVFLNERQVYEIDVPVPKLKIKGITIHFEGAGSVKNVELKNGNRVLYSSNFKK